VGGIPEVIEDGVDGLLVPSAAPDDLARAVETLIADPARRAALGEAGRLKAHAVFSPQKIVPLYENLYRRVKLGLRDVRVRS